MCLKFSLSLSLTQYRIFLSQNRLANALGSCALSALLCATGLTTAAFVAPENAVAAPTDVIGVTIPAATTSWSSTGDISASSTSDTGVYGIKATPTGSLSMTLESGHTLTVTSDVPTGDAFAYGIYAKADGDNDITNSGIIDANVESTGSTAKVYGINAYAANGDNDITNSGTIKANANTTVSATDSYATAYGIYAYANSGDNDITNDGTITATATVGYAYACGIDATADGDNDITNSGTINVTATGDKAYAYGISADATNGDNDITNNGTIDANAEATGGDAEVYGIRAYAAIGDNDITNNGTIDANAEATGDYAYAYGINAEADSGDNDITNDGTITANAEATGGFATAYGIYAYAAIGDNDITNDGTITANAEATSDYVKAYGIHTYAKSGDNDITNDGTITANAEATGLSAYAYGISQKAKKGDNDITNNGTITATATGSFVKAYGIDADADSNNDITNSGTINATATGGIAEAAGIVVDGTSATLNNFGIIDVSASGKNATAYQAYVESGTANVGTWALKLGETYGAQANGSTYYVFGVDSGATLNFGATSGQGADFIIYGLDEDFVTGQEYKISDMVDGNATGYLATATSAFDFFPAELIGTGNYANQSIKATINITADNSPAHAGATQLLANLKGHLSGLGKVIGNQRGNIGGADGLQAAKSETSTMYADASTTVTDAGGSYFATESLVWRAFLMPFYSTTSDNGGAYDTNMTGLVAGAHRNMNDDFVFGFHVSLAKANGEGTYTDSDTLSYALGINGVYNIDKSLYVRGQLTGFFAENDFDMVSSTSPWGHNASAEMDTYGVYAELAAGYDIVLAPQHMLTPELALSYMYAHMEGFDADFNGTSFSMASENYDALYADASVRWTGTYDLGTSEKGNNLGILKPTVRAGVRQALADPEVSSTMNVFGTSATTHADANETSFTCEAGLAWTLDALTLSATYSGEFGDVEYSHMGMFKAEWEF